MKKTTLSVIVPLYNPDQHLLGKLLDSIPCVDNVEVILVDDCSSSEYSIRKKENTNIKLICKKKNSGPAASRNIGAEAACGEFLFFTDDDCRFDESSFNVILASTSECRIQMGNTITDVKTRLGRRIALLGFPGGGILGFDKVWNVVDGKTNSISSCNLLINRNVFFSLDGFDESFPVPGGEDTLLAYHASRKGIPISYNASQIVYHVERNSWKGFYRWQFIRGRAAYFVKQKKVALSNYTLLRLKTYYRSLSEAWPRDSLFVFLLILVSMLSNLSGYLSEVVRKEQVE